MFSRLTDLFWALAGIFVAAFIAEEDAAELERQAATAREDGQVDV